MVDASGARRLLALAHVASRVEAGPPVPPATRVTVHFHPDRLVAGRPLLEVLIEENLYRSQFVTGTSNGGFDPAPGGRRHAWESRMFGGVYDHGPASERPIYGSLNHRLEPAGGSVRFGSSHLVLRRDVLPRTTFCYPDSVHEPTAFGTGERMPLVETALSHHDVDVLDDYIEAHVHGPLRLDTDVEALVLDPSFRGTELDAIARRAPVPVRWHHGFELTSSRFDHCADYRGPRIADLARSVARDGRLTAYIVGQAANTGEHDDQHVKQLWHCVARFGHDWSDRPGAATSPAEGRIGRG
ncbi:DUF3626 domain-containing protein [Rhodococcus sp. BP-149]|uniref:DUF3626 domain-containing protein n=1 Tax=unclassified Rhodococcus (in: high G+C Gram-positive bacteria) TaxID=192944 RepID=UPI001D934014|nr:MULTISPECIES: DUF3626 domain-containing protein [unclassified Rhodococcus (in: high G+C Gram-positive bacteria)]MBY6684623.1 DUF3626 domain-containing protein [Rhodococcus sp. BP-288]MBY6695410.1 DUF3626 domain-containing protein [Rhodococcus sp. BP-188]MBY6698791.1 DUF3626 domain-containing protein [Rhodococcus sp. BP-285]MBY6701470.1 DUF3626 domain-containing protein [Rhodococcus sp. BP-283]MBY6712471.1 DUF3626 domain-containing protein [Rhodococcus sp. BP-160]